MSNAQCTCAEFYRGKPPRPICEIHEASIPARWTSAPEEIEPDYDYEDSYVSEFDAEE